MKGMNISRRTFTKGSALAGLGAALGIGSTGSLVHSEKAYAEGEAEVKATCCRACIAFCPAKGYVRNGKLIKVEGMPGSRRNEGRLCLKGLSQPQVVYHPRKLKYPMKRVGERGTDAWERISWEEAIDIISTAIVEENKKYGGASLVGAAGGGGSFSLGDGAALVNQLGGYNFFEPGGAQCHTPRQVCSSAATGLKTSLSIADGNCQEIYFPELTPMKVLVIWGNNPASNNVACGGRALARLRKQGVKTIVVDPRFTPEASKADVWLPLRPSTDVAMGMGWIRYIIENKKYDEEFCMKWTTLPYLVNPETLYLFRADEVIEGASHDDYVVWDKKTESPKAMPYPWDDNLDPADFGTYTVTGVDGKTYESYTGFQALKDSVEEWTLEKTAEVCWVDKADLEAALELYTNEEYAGISEGVAGEQAPHAMKYSQVALTIDFLMGNVEKPGVTYNQFGSGMKHTAVSPRKYVTEEIAANTIGTSDKYRVMFASFARTVIPSLLDALETGKPYRPTVYLDFSLNKLSALAEPQRWVEALKNVPYIFQTSLYMTSFTHECVDVVLPTSDWSEIDLKADGQINSAAMVQRLVHIGETINVVIVCGMIARACAEKGMEFPKGALEKWAVTDEEWRESVAKSVLEGTPLEGTMDYAQLCEYLNENGPIEAQSPEKYRTFEIYKSIDSKTGLPLGFPSPSKKADLYGECYLRIRDTGLPFLDFDLGELIGPSASNFSPTLYYEEPGETPMDDTEYPLVYSSGRFPHYHHGTLRNVPYLREIMPAPPLWIHPSTAEQYGIADGDWVKASSRRGSATFKAVVTQGVNPGVVMGERFWNPEKLEGEKVSGGWTEMNMQCMASAQPPYCPESGSYTLRGFQVKIEKGEKPEGVWVEPEDFAPWMPEPTDSTEAVH